MATRVAAQTPQEELQAWLTFRQKIDAIRADASMDQTQKFDAIQSLVQSVPNGANYYAGGNLSPEAKALTLQKGADGKDYWLNPETGKYDIEKKGYWSNWESWAQLAAGGALGGVALAGALGAGAAPSIGSGAAAGTVSVPADSLAAITGGAANSGLPAALTGLGGTAGTVGTVGGATAANLSTAGGAAGAAGSAMPGTTDAGSTTLGTPDALANGAGAGAKSTLQTAEDFFGSPLGRLIAQFGTGTLQGLFSQPLFQERTTYRGTDADPIKMAGNINSAISGLMPKLTGGLDNDVVPDAHVGSVPGLSPTPKNLLNPASTGTAPQRYSPEITTSNSGSGTSSGGGTTTTTGGVQAGDGTTPRVRATSSANRVPYQAPGTPNADVQTDPTAAALGLNKQAAAAIKLALSTQGGA